MESERVAYRVDEARHQLVLEHGLAEVAAARP